MKVLLLDHEAFYIPEEFRSGMLRPINSNLYNVSEETLQKIKEVLKDSPDVIIIGNNMLSGLKIAVLVSDELKPKTIVVWNYMPIEADVEKYRRLGFSHFCDRQSTSVRKQISEITTTISQEERSDARAHYDLLRDAQRERDQ